jgi:hypothetical protein
LAPEKQALGLAGCASHLRQGTTSGRIAVWAEILKVQARNWANLIDVGFDASCLGIFWSNQRQTNARAVD